ncbi:MAG: patatin-like phospholipase family protein [Candidatus Schekmanbacteria bacterium]|nr:patatin-like phospholipase family protein [Candidatus Schekmanbacteria bacterium]
MKKFYFFIISLVIISACAHKEVVVKPPPKPVKIAVVLGAGASRGFAHIGVLKILEANKIPINMVVGTSAGSFVGSLYAYGYDGFELQKIALTMEKDVIVDFTIPDNGFVKGEKIENFINNALKNTPIEKLKIPFYAVATKIPEGKEIVFGKGNTGLAVRASCSIPGIFRPVIITDKMYIDGGVVSPVAVDAARRLGADVVIAVDILADLDKEKPTGTIDTILHSINIMYSKLAISQLADADIVIRPKVGYIDTTEFEKRHEAIIEGEKAALEAMPQINSIITELKNQGRL